MSMQGVLQSIGVAKIPAQISNLEVHEPKAKMMHGRRVFFNQGGVQDGSQWVLEYNLLQQSQAKKGGYHYQSYEEVRRASMS